MTKSEEYIVKWTTDNETKIAATSEEEATNIVKDMLGDMSSVMRARNFITAPAWKKVPEDRVYEIRLAAIASVPIEMLQGDFMHVVFDASKKSNILGHGLEINWVNSEKGK